MKTDIFFTLDIYEISKYRKPFDSEFPFSKFLSTRFTKMLTIPHISFKMQGIP